MNYLDATFGISEATSNESEKSFKDWMHNDRKPRGASSKVVRWRPRYDSARALICAAFGLDFGSIILMEKDYTQEPGVNGTRTAETANCLFRQRISVYMQRESKDFRPPQNMKNFNTAPHRLPKHTWGNVMIICEYSSGEVGEITSTHALMTPDLSHSLNIPNQDDSAALSVVQNTIIHIFSRVCQIWRGQVVLLHDEHADLEDHIYEQPADGSRAGNIWAMSQHLHEMLKLINRHAKIIEAVQEDFRSFLGSEREQDWLDHTINEFAQLSHDLSTDYLEPLKHMVDLASVQQRKAILICCLPCADVQIGDNSRFEAIARTRS
jgi:hypothetical protein